MGLPLFGGLVQAGLSIKGQRDAAKQQARVQAQASGAERQRFLQQMTASRIDQAQERIAAAKRIQEAQRASRAALSKSVVSAGEAGVSGVSVDALEGDIQRETAEFTFGTQQQLEFNDIARNFAMKDAKMATTMNQLRINQPIQQPDFASSIFGAVQTGLNLKSLDL